MRFAIKATDKEGRVGWIMPATAQGIRTIGLEGEAAIFSTKAQAERVIARLADTPIGKVGLTFEVAPQ